MTAELGGQRLVRVYAKHDPYWETGHLGEVVAEMRELGAPTIKVVEWRGDYFAIEGSHRLCAAYHLGVTPNVVVEDQDRHDPDGEAFWESLRATLPHYAWLLPAP